MIFLLDQTIFGICHRLTEAILGSNESPLDVIAFLLQIADPACESHDAVLAKSLQRCDRAEALHMI
jgi:hypothetical protein